jgi:Mannosylglycerate hydrolase MGH1-like glycoside hydrolase domain
MRTWNLKTGDPLSLTLAADSRFSATDYMNDHIWELVLAGGDPPALAVQTTFGLRARSFRLFPRFSEAGVSLTDPASFSRSPAVHLFSPNSVRLSFAPFVGIEVAADYWVPESHAIAGCLKITNQGKETRLLRFEWAAILNPSANGQRLSPIDMGTFHVLAGKTEDLSPVIFVTGGIEPVTSPYTALGLDLDLPAGTTRILTWVEAGMGDVQASFALARQVAARNWEAESARIELMNAGQVEIYTGDLEWDAAFALSQKIALGLICGPTPSLPAASFVFTRQPNFGYSPRGDGSDYNHLWNGQSPLEACYLADMLLPAFPLIVQGVVRNFLASQNQPGVIDWKPGMGGQRSQLLATPLLACLTWKIYQVTQDISFLEDAFPALLNYFHTWFDPQHDRDGDGIPEWDHVLQTGFEDHPLFAHWDNWSRGIDITTVESPSLCAFLYRECLALKQIAEVLSRSEPILALKAHAENLKAAVEASWNDKFAIYQYWDRDTHRSPVGETLGERYGSGEIVIRRDFEHAARILVRIHIIGEPVRQVQIFIHGTGPSGQHLIERVPSNNLRWYLGLGSATSDRVYTNLERVEILGIEEPDRITLQTVGFDCPDHTVLLPLWVGIPDQERAHMLIETITAENSFWQPYGIRACVSLPAQGEESLPCQSVHLPWNVVIGEGLVDYGFRKEAAALVTRLMKAIIQNLKRDSAFRKLYHSLTGAGSGERDALTGLAPLRLFLYTLGVKIFSPTRVEIAGINPFPWPVTVKYRGLTVLRQNEKTTVIFPDGQAVTLEGPEPRAVVLE